MIYGDFKSVLILILFQKIVNAFKIIVTIAMTTSEHVRCFSSLKFIENFSRSIMGEGSLTSVVMLSIENGPFLIRSMKSY